jgi:hypothetical protein
MLLVGMWGRTVAVDAATVEQAAQTIVDADLATQRIESWLERGLGTAMTADAGQVADVAASIAARPEFDAAVDVIIADFVSGLFADPGEDPVVAIDDALAPLLPVVVDEARSRDIPVEPASIEQMLETASSIPIDTGEAASVASVVRDARTLLTWIVVLAAGGLLVTGALAVMLSERRYAMVRTLAIRVVISALTYALFFRVAAWALDPERGRSPVLGGGSVVLASNGHIFVIAGVLAAVVAAWGGTVAFRRARRVPAVPLPPVSDDDTRELVAV